MASADRSLRRLSFSLETKPVGAPRASLKSASDAGGGAIHFSALRRVGARAIFFYMETFEFWFLVVVGLGLAWFGIELTGLA